jgi:hypothetical protein
VIGAVRPGYEPLRHQVSLLSLGDGGWIQVASFLVSGGLMIVFAFALRARSLDGPGAGAAPVGLGLTGIGLLLAGAFSTQPLFGYPPGTPDGMATEISPASVLHVTGAGLLIFGLIGAALALVRRFRRMGDTGWAAASLAVAVVAFVFFGAAGGGPSGQLLFPEVSGLLQRISLVTGFGWVAAIALREIRAASPSALTTT